MHAIRSSKDKVKDLIHAGQKIAAIKYLREQYPLSLKDANDWADYLSGHSTTEPSTETNIPEQ